MPLPFALNHINLWLLEDSDEHGDGWTIVDTGYGVAATHELWERHFGGIMGGKPVKRIIVTHYHPDHVGCAAWLHEKTGAPVWMTSSEYLSAHAAAEDVAGFDRQNSARLFMAHGLAKARPDFADAQQVRSGAYKRGVPTVPKQYHRIMENDEFKVGKRSWRVITAFGHAPEHATLFSAEGNILISGDQVLPRISSNVSVHPTEPDANPMRDWLESLAKLKREVPDDVLVLPSHNECFRGLHARLDYLAASQHRTLDRLRNSLAQPRRAVDVFVALFARGIEESSPNLLGMATGESVACLNYLLHRGEAQLELDAAGVGWYRLQSV